MLPDSMFSVETLWLAIGFLGQGLFFGRWQIRLSKRSTGRDKLRVPVSPNLARLPYELTTYAALSKALDLGFDVEPFMLNNRFQHLPEVARRR